MFTKHFAILGILVCLLVFVTKISAQPSVSNNPPTLPTLPVLDSQTVALPDQELPKPKLDNKSVSIQGEPIEPVFQTEKSDVKPNNPLPQYDSTRNEQTRFTPVITGYGTYGTSFKSGEKTFTFSLNPIVLVPVGEKGLLAMEWEMQWNIERMDGTTKREFEQGLEYLQFNQPLTNWATAVFGKFLTPGMFNERLHPGWIKKTNVAPFSAGLLSSSGTGFMLRGAMPIGSGVNLTYSPFFTTTIDNKYFSSERMVGGRIGTFFKTKGLDLGILLARSLQGKQANIYAADCTYISRNKGLELRGEYYFRENKGSAYWAETAKRFKNVPKAFLRKFELVGRFEQAFVTVTEEMQEPSLINTNKIRPITSKTNAEMAEGDSDHGSFPEVNTKRFIGSINYYINDGLKLYFSYGREIPVGLQPSKNIWEFGLAVRWLK